MRKNLALMSFMAMAPRVAFMAGLRRGAWNSAVYTPHGGSLHYNWLAFPGFIFLAANGPWPALALE